MPSSPSESDYDRSVDIVRSAIPRMSEMKIPITPSNYAVWYEYLSQSNQALREEMDALLNCNRPVTNNDMRVLYERYLEERSDKVQIAKVALTQVVNALMSHISQAEVHYDSFTSELNKIAQGLADDVSVEGLNSLIDRAVRATNTALESGVKLKQKFSDLADEMQQLRVELARSQEEARSDALTGLSNRLALQEELANLAERGIDDSHTPCLLLIDVDFFKRINDRYGHLVGDHVLQAVAKLLKSSVRAPDVVARYGGEEFAVLLRDTPRTVSQAVAENISTNIARTPIELPDGFGSDKDLSVSVSIGAAWYREREPTEALVDRADRALYASKKNGRNRVTWENRDTEPSIRNRNLKYEI